MTYKQRRLRKEKYDYNCGVMFSEKTMYDKDIKLVYYGTIQNLYDYELENTERD